MDRWWLTSAEPVVTLTQNHRKKKKNLFMSSVSEGTVGKMRGSV